MTPYPCIPLSTATLRALLDYQDEHNDDIDLSRLADRAIHEWLERQREASRPLQQRGYFWKALFLPDGTRLRISNHAVTRYAAIEGDELVHNAMSMSPNQFVQMTLGTTRNAWSVVYVQLPGEREWTLVLRLRQALEAQGRPPSQPRRRPAHAHVHIHVHARSRTRTTATATATAIVIATTIALAIAIARATASPMASARRTTPGADGRLGCS